MIIDCKTFFNNSVKLIKIKLFKDQRGVFYETFQKKYYLKIGINDNFVQDNYSFTKKMYTLRGLHFQKTPMQQSKLLTLINGKITDVIVDLRKKSNFYGQYIKINMSKNSYNQIYIPKGFAHGFLTKSNDVKVTYKVNNYYSPRHEKTIIWNDKILNINWNLKNINPIISSKDQKGISFNLI